uniref:FkbM family methyltransferase n=1 Tax=Geobacter metallireducens TaxID=28232 RepID=A0A831U6P4_GEOME
MKIKTFESIEELKRFFGFQRDGIIIENDIDLVESECDLFERKRRDAEVLTILSANCDGACLDIGTSHGRSAAELASNNPSQTIYTVNLLPEQISAEETFITHLLTKEEIGSYYRKLNLNNIEQIYANTFTWVVPDTIRELGIVFVDGNHDTKAVFSDTNLIYDRVKHGGFILWHDFSPTLRNKYEWINAVMTGVEQFLEAKSLDAEVFHLKNSWIGFIQVHKATAAKTNSVSPSVPATESFLTDKQYWSSKHSSSFSPWPVKGMLFSSILEKYLPTNESYTCAEIGAYPGANLCYLAHRFKYKPAAIEFSDYADNIKSLFEFNGITSYEIINKDFFEVSDKQYDVVTSFGFIEHFDNYANAIKKHFDLLKPGGYLVLSVPRFDGFQGALFELAFDSTTFNEMIAAHNLEITDINKLKHTVSQFTDSILYCDYANDGIVYYDWNHPQLRDDRRWLIYFINKISGILGESLPADQFFSPHILLIARKPTHPFTPSNTAISATLESASRKLSAGDNAGAISLLAASIRQFPEYLETYQILAELQSLIGQQNQAEQTLLSALETSPQNLKIFHELSRLYTTTGNTDKLNLLHRHMTIWHPGSITSSPSADQQSYQQQISVPQNAPNNGYMFPTSCPVTILGQNQNVITCMANGNTWKLDATKFVDREILSKGIFEPESTYWVSHIVKEGMTVLDVGANFGYFTVQFSKLVGTTGQVYAFEPSNHFHRRLTEHLDLNGCTNVTVLKMGLSDVKRDLQLLIDDSTATLYWHDDAKKPVATETIHLETLDSYIESTGLNKIDFIKIDIDGAEPQFIRGAQKTLRKYRPILLIEFAQLVLMAAGSDVPALAKQLKDLGYTFYSERNGQPFPSEAQFLRETMNCSHSVNIICIPSNS